MSDSLDYRLMTVCAVRRKFFEPRAVSKKDIVGAIERGELVASWVCGRYMIREDDARAWIATPIPAKVRAKKSFKPSPVSGAALKARSDRADERLRALGVIK